MAAHHVSHYLNKVLDHIESFAQQGEEHEMTDLQSAWVRSLSAIDNTIARHALRHELVGVRRDAVRRGGKIYDLIGPGDERDANRIAALLHVGTKEPVSVVIRRHPFAESVRGYCGEGSELYLKEAMRRG